MSQNPPSQTSSSGDEIFIVDNADPEWKTREYLREWSEFARSIDIATGYFEIGALLQLEGFWQKLDGMRILMGDEVTARTHAAILAGLKARAERVVDESLEREKEGNDFLSGVPAIVEAIESQKIACRVYARRKFHAKAYINHSRSRVIGSRALVGSSNFTSPGLTDNIELNLNIRSEVDKLQAWFDKHWEEGDDISADLLRVIGRHIALYSPWQVQARALRELMRHHIPDVPEWEKNGSKIYPLLAEYQKQGYASLMQIAEKHGGAFLCDGVGLGKTFVGMMVIERLLHDRKKVVLLSPKAAKDPVWQTTLKKYLPGAFGAWGGLRLFSHTDLGRTGLVDDGSGLTWDEMWADVAANADAFVIDEAHHFRNPGTLGDERKRESRYRTLFRLAEGKAGQSKPMFLLTATPVNNSLRDFQHMTELFSRDQPNYFAATLGIHSLPTYFGELEKKLAREGRNGVIPAPSGEQTEIRFDNVDEIEAETVLRDDKLFRAVVVQRSRAYARDSQLQEALAKGQDADHQQIFPTREDPKTAAYSIKKSYERLLQMVEEAFSKSKPLFALGIYYPLAYANPAEKARLLSLDKRVENQQQQVVSLIRTNFLKRFESSTAAFEISCSRLLLKLLTWVEIYASTDRELRRLETWKKRNAAVLEYVAGVVPGAFAKAQIEGDSGEDCDEELEDDAGLLSRDAYEIHDLLDDCFQDLDQLAEFLNELRKFKPSQDDKLRALKELLKKEIGERKVLIFTQFSDTARYLQDQLTEAGFKGVDEIDSGTKNARNEVIQKFAPYYNDSSSSALKQKGWAETRILIATDVLSEGLNLQDATRLVNYDLHWNPVRLMQRIGRVDRRMNPDIEAQMVLDHPHLAFERGNNNTVCYWNFLPPDELDSLLRLYKRLTHKTLLISKTFGIEGRKLFTPDDEYDALRDFTHVLEGEKSVMEELSLEWQTLVAQNPNLPAELDALPGRLFSGKAHPTPGARALFFCYVLPAKGETGEWTHEGGEVVWLLLDLATDKIQDSPSRIAEYIRCSPETPRRVSGEDADLSKARVKVEKLLRLNQIKKLQIPMGQMDKPLLRCWMELL